MKKITVFALLLVALAGSNHAIGNPQIAATEPGRAPRQLAAPDQSLLPGEAEMQAVCREVQIATDEGYGITDHVTRFICDETR